ncbi:hypothetical protein HanXRQr2_Chr12g0531001 [Helianthus annuus]|uniref:Uncharacterized protein n=1 Tax=Helianthus annuus TaxID=4232 RepID=A0A9K3HDX9_HELAN|nr:hypothetical protein HanXRQr2_Chr12g0531001 [Helianthus annuus]
MVWSGDHRARFKLKTLTLFSPSCQYDRQYEQRTRQNRCYPLGSQLTILPPPIRLSEANARQ